MQLPIYKFTATFVCKP